MLLCLLVKIPGTDKSHKTTSPDRGWSGVNFLANMQALNDWNKAKLKGNCTVLEN